MTSKSVKSDAVSLKNKNCDPLSIRTLKSLPSATNGHKLLEPFIKANYNSDTVAFIVRRTLQV